MLVIQMLFLVAGLWAVISGKIPAGLFSFLFGKGEYEVSSNNARWFGVFLLSPLPASFLATILLTLLFGSKGGKLGIAFEYVYLFTVIILSIIIARRIRHPKKPEIDVAQLDASPAEPKKSSYGLRLLVIFGIIFLGCLTVTSGGSLIMSLLSFATIGAHWTGKFQDDVLPFVIAIVITGIGVFGIIKLVRVLRRSA